MYSDYNVNGQEYLDMLGTLLDEEKFEEPTDIGAVAILKNWEDDDTPPF